MSLQITRRYTCSFAIAIALGCSSPAPTDDETAAAAAALASTPFCTASMTVATHCDSNADCTGGEFCTRSWNQELEWQTAGTAFGHCVDLAGGTDASAALQADLCTLPLPADYSRGVPYRLAPNGVLLISDFDGDHVGLHVFRRVIIDGSGAVIQLDREEDSAEAPFIGIRVRAGSPSYGEEYADPWNNANWSSIRDITIRPSAGFASNLMVGIAILSHGIRLDNVHAMSLGTGVLVYGAAGSGGANSSDFRFNNLLLTGNYTYGAHIRGSDSQAGLTLGMEVTNGTGVRESSFLGNTHIAPHFEGNDRVSTDLGSALSLQVDGSTNGTTVVGAYVENSDPAPTVPEANAPVLFLGGNMTARAPNHVERVGYGRSRVVFRHTAPPSGRDYRVIIPARANTHYDGAFQFRRMDSENYDWRLAVEGGDWGFFNEASTISPFRWKSFAAGGSHLPGAFMLGTRSREQGFCSDGLDNDLDGDVDSDDSDCP